MLYLDSFPQSSFSFGSCIAIGTFDGVHKGHQKIIKELVETSISYNVPAIICTFVPHPRSITHNMDILFLYTLEMREEVLYKYLNYYSEGKVPVYVVCIPFTELLSLKTAEEFIETELMPFCFPKNLILGENAFFGADKGESLIKYVSFIKRVSPVYYQNKILSSSSIRTALLNGDIEYVTHSLGKYYTLEGRVVSGYRRGSTVLGFPTANITIPETLIPSKGVYAVYVIHKGKRYIGVMNIGFNPTFSGKELSIEVHILGFNRMIYGDFILLECIKKLRNEKHFSSINALIVQIKEDIIDAKNITDKEQCF